MGDLQIVTDALRRAEAVFCALPVAAAQCSAAMRYLWVSQRYADWLGVARNQIVGHAIVEVMGPERLQGMRPHVEAALAGKPVQRDAEVVHKTLGPRWVHVDSVPTFDASGAPDGWIEAIADVTELRHIERSLQGNRRTLQSFYDSSRKNVRPQTGREAAWESGSRSFATSWISMEAPSRLRARDWAGAAYSPFGYPSPVKSPRRSSSLRR